MDLVVCTKLVYDETQIPVEDGSLMIDQAPVKISDADLNALEEAARIKEGEGGTVTAIIVATGPFDDAVLNEALAMNVDRAFIVEGDEVAGHNPYRTAQAICEVIQKENIKYDLILCGEGSSDQYSCALPAMIGEILGIPVITFAGKLEVYGDKIRAERYLESGFEVLEVSLPAVISVTPEINEPRIPTVLQIMRAKKKEKVRIKASDLTLSYPVIELVGMKAYVRERLREKLEGSTSEIIDRILEIFEEKRVIR